MPTLKIGSRLKLGGHPVWCSRCPCTYLSVFLLRLREERSESRRDLDESPERFRRSESRRSPRPDELDELPLLRWDEEELEGERDDSELLIRFAGGSSLRGLSRRLLPRASGILSRYIFPRRKPKYPTHFGND